jgi:hypothetical protein
MHLLISQYTCLSANAPAKNTLGLPPPQKKTSCMITCSSRAVLRRSADDSSARTLARLDGFSARYEKASFWLTFARMSSIGLLNERLKTDLALVWLPGFAQDFCSQLCLYVSLSFPNLSLNLNMPAWWPAAPVVEAHFWLDEHFYIYTDGWWWEIRTMCRLGGLDKYVNRYWSALDDGYC